MFDTHPEAEIKFTRAYSPLSQQRWNWVEFAIQIPCLLISVSLESDAGSFSRNFLFGSLKEAMSLIAASRDICKHLEIGLLSPGYMNGSGSYQLGQVKEIWRRRGGHEQMFVMADGTKLSFPPEEFVPIDREMELVVSL